MTSLNLQYGHFYFSPFAIFKRPQLLHFSSDLDETGIRTHGLLRSFIQNIVIVRVAVPFKKCKVSFFVQDSKIPLVLARVKGNLLHRSRIHIQKLASLFSPLSLCHLDQYNLKINEEVINLSYTLALYFSLKIISLFVLYQSISRPLIRPK